MKLRFDNNNEIVQEKFVGHSRPKTTPSCFQLQPQKESSKKKKRIILKGPSQQDWVYLDGVQEIPWPTMPLREPFGPPQPQQLSHVV